MDPAAFRTYGHELVEWIAAYLERPDRYPVLSRAEPGQIATALPLKNLSRSVQSWPTSSGCWSPA
jgi:aromatic-L-amino-acid decarboxylase